MYVYIYIYINDVLQYLKLCFLFLIACLHVVRCSLGVKMNSAWKMDCLDLPT